MILSKVPKEVLETQYKIKLPPRENKRYNCQTFLQLFAAKKGWITGRSLPNEFQAAKRVMKDFTSGKLLYVTLRPDYDVEKHGVVAQTGYKLDMTQEEEPDAQNYEELKSANESSSTVELSEKSSSVKIPEYEIEDDFDNQFFKKGMSSKITLNKGEKRALKFALQKGVDVNEVDDLKTFLQSQLKESKQTHNTPVYMQG